MSTTARTGPRDLLESSIGLIERTMAAVTRRHGFTPADSEEFVGWAWLKLVEDDYRIIRRFRGNSALSTYLSKVIANLARDYRIQNWGKWRPSVAARRMGTEAVALERLLVRDRMSFGEAVQTLRHRHGDHRCRARLERIAAALPDRMPRPRTRTGITGSVPVESDVEERLADVRRRADERRLMAAFLYAWRTLESDDRRILAARFVEGRTVVSIAEEAGVEARRMYPRIERLLRTLRREMVSRGVGPDQVRELLEWPRLTFDLAAIEQGDTPPAAQRDGHATTTSAKDRAAATALSHPRAA